MTILIDNYDSFSYNLYQLVGAINPDIKVIRNDEFTCEEIEAMNPDHIIISPGPGRPSDAGMCEDAVRYLQEKYQSSACVSDIRRFVRHMVRQSHMQRNLCMERCRWLMWI